MENAVYSVKVAFKWLTLSLERLVTQEILRETYLYADDRPYMCPFVEKSVLTDEHLCVLKHGRLANKVFVREFKCSLFRKNGI